MLLQERKPQRWRALAKLNNGGEQLLCLGHGLADVQNGYPNAWYNLLDLEERTRVVEIDLQKWSGTSTRGYWMSKFALELLPLDLKDCKVV